MTDLGTGVLTWDGAERRSDRYGAVWLMQDGCTATSRIDPVPQLDVRAASGVVGQTGRLVAQVVDARESTHIGDLFRGIFPSKPSVGDRIVLGEGTLFLEPCSFGFTVGLRPDDGRDADWLDPHALYRAHEQMVRLFFEVSEDVE